VNAHSLQGLPVRTPDGKKIGCVHDLRCVHVRTGSRVTHLVYGRRGMLERFGFRGERFDTIPWSNVVEVRAREVIVELDGRKR
jgi:sporulation protein YlmC with PRC-barrel domain